jgi:hypothetical protein
MSVKTSKRITHSNQNDEKSWRDTIMQGSAVSTVIMFVFLVIAIFTISEKRFTEHFDIHGSQPMWWIYIVAMFGGLHAGISGLIDVGWYHSNEKKKSSLRYAGTGFCLFGLLLTIYPLAWLSVAGVTVAARDYFWMATIGVIVCLFGLVVAVSSRMIGDSAGIR